MTELKNIQQNFQAQLLKRHPDIFQQITGTTEELVKTRLSIYNNSYRFRLLEALENDYSALVDYLPHEDFANMGFAYIKTHPSKSYAISVFGQHLENFLATAEAYQDKRYLSELAGFVWTLNSTIDAANAPILTMNDMSVIPQERWGDMVLTLHPSARIYTAQWNVLPIWQAVIQNQQPPAPMEQATPTYCLLWRKGTQPYYSILGEQDLWLFQALQQARSFEEICGGLLQWFPEDQVATYAVNLLLQWLNDEMLSKVELREEQNDD